MNKFFDISMPVKNGMVVWPGGVKFKRREIRDRDSVLSNLSMMTHTGTHIDAPKHFVRGGKSVDKLLLENLIGPCRVLNAGSQVDLSLLKQAKLKKGERILFKTLNSTKKLLAKSRFTSDYVSLDMEAASYLVKQKVSLVGTDYLGVEKKGAPGHPVHKKLLRAGVVVVEGLDLSKITAGKYNLAVLPLRLVGADGSPARAVVWK